MGTELYSKRHLRGALLLGVTMQFLIFSQNIFSGETHLNHPMGFLRCCNLGCTFQLKCVPLPYNYDFLGHI